MDEVDAEAGAGSGGDGGGSGVNRPGWALGLVLVAGLLVFAPLALYLWAGGDDHRPEPRRPVEEVTVSACRIDPSSRRVTAEVTVANPGADTGRYVVTVRFRRGEDGAESRALVEVPGVEPGREEHGEAVGPVWPREVVPWCAVAAAEFREGAGSGPSAPVGGAAAGPGR
ncbi:hypothetical protein ACN20G_08200 [Streptomyces sp. BI20]|uniref:hypothetical protein n=1 Tax=Streptomyces sp. BI20 TaxID=3403460 RepID=UPI003C7124C3